jgi:alkylated DNA repair dioxygenase AlkB
MNPTKSYTSILNNINVHYYGNFIDENKADEYFNILEQNVVYNTDEQSQVTVFGKKHVIPRKQVAFGDEGTSYGFAGVTVMANQWTGNDILSKILQEIKTKVEEYTGKTFNFVLLNRYKDGDSYIGAHRDDEKELGDDPAITSVSFGAARELVFAPYRFIPLADPNLELNNDKLSIVLEHGSLCVMLDKTNTYWTHCIPKRAKIKTPRVSLTFRLIHL